MNFLASAVLLSTMPVYLCGCAVAPGPYSKTYISSEPLLSLQGSYHKVRPGDTLWRIAHSYGLDTRTLALANHIESAHGLSVGQRLFIPLPPESNRFLWPVIGALKTSGYTSGLEIVAPAGSLVRASRGGQVAVATQKLSGWGKTVIIDHLDGYFTVYSGLEQIIVSPSVSLRQGSPIGSLGARALHFEIRYGSSAKDTLALLSAQ